MYLNMCLSCTDLIMYRIKYSYYSEYIATRTERNPTKSTMKNCFIYYFAICILLIIIYPYW